jgi:hypothetical protein
MIPKSGGRFSDKIMLKQEALIDSNSIQLRAYFTRMILPRLQVEGVRPCPCLAGGSMSTLRVRRTWWIMQRQAADAPLFRELSRRWRSLDQRERRLTPFVLALSVDPPAKSSRSTGTQSRIKLVAAQMKKSARNWNPWMLTK